MAKRTNNDLQNTTQKLKREQHEHHYLKTGLSSTSDTRPVTLVTIWYLKIEPYHEDTSGKNIKWEGIY
jgi:hypothetical protein